MNSESVWRSRQKNGHLYENSVSVTYFKTKIQMIDDCSYIKILVNVLAIVVDLVREIIMVSP